MAEERGIDPEIEKRIREKTLLYFQMTQVTWRWWNILRRIKGQWRRFRVMREADRRRRHLDFVNDRVATKSKSVLGELPGRRSL